jgi:hypothetical protein
VRQRRFTCRQQIIERSQRRPARGRLAVLVVGHYVGAAGARHAIRSAAEREASVKR